MKTYILFVIILFFITVCSTLFVILKSQKSASYLVYPEVTKDAKNRVGCLTLTVNNSLPHHRWLTDRLPCRYEPHL